MQHHAVLVIDDEKMVLKAIQRALRGEPYQVFLANGGEAALQLLEAREISLVISDFRMPGMDGLELLETIKQDYPHILAIMLTGQAETEVAIKAINEAGVYKFLQKPWDDAELKRVIRQVLTSIEKEPEWDALKQKIRARNAIIDRLEKHHPGITETQ